MTKSGNKVRMCSRAALKADKVSSLIPDFKWFRYSSLRDKVRFPMEMKTNSVRCSIVFAAAWVMLALKSIRYWSSSMAAETLFELLPLLSERKLFSWACIPCCILNLHRLKLAAWLQITVASLEDFSHLHIVSCEIWRDAGGVEDKPACLAILLLLLFSLQTSVLQDETAEGSTFWSENSPYHLVCDFAGLKNWSFNRPLASELREGFPSTEWRSIVFGPAKGYGNDILQQSDIQFSLDRQRSCNLTGWMNCLCLGYATSP